MLKNVLGVQKNICLTLDIWSSRQMRSYLGITAHFTRNWTFENVVLACKRFRSRHTARRIMEEYEQIIKDFEISSKITNIFTDNAANMISAFSLPGFFDTTSDTNDETDLEDDDLDDVNDSELFEVLSIEHNSCFAHTLQLAVKDGLKEAGQLNISLSKASKLVSFVHKSTIAIDVQAGEKKVRIRFCHSLEFTGEDGQICFASTRRKAK